MDKMYFHSFSAWIRKLFSEVLLVLGCGIKLLRSAGTFNKRPRRPQRANNTSTILKKKLLQWTKRGEAKLRENVSSLLQLEFVWCVH